ncbi:glycogen/starch/alpha-glucan phosphorylase, partial [Streptococcus danieliae]|nr:glycogen/starch/alpha-glucan phosphorylase [Streptococcus danieliae]
IAELAGLENIYTFGKDSDYIIDLYERHAYKSSEYYNNDELIKRAVDFILSDEVKKVGNEERLTRLHNELVNKDWFMTLIDLKEYIEIKEKVFEDYEDRDSWNKKVIRNIAKAGFFSSDRTIEQYNKDIWKSK